MLGHRGAAALAPENTLSAVRAARRAGADGIEIDVRTTRDGALVVLHDPTLWRIAGETAHVADVVLADLRAVRTHGEPIPTLDEVLDEAAGMLVNVEMKTDGTPGAIAGLERRLASRLGRRSDDRVLVSSFDAWSLRRFRRAAPSVATGLLIDPERARWLRRSRAGVALGVRAVHPHVSLCDAASVARWRAAGWAVVVWTVNHSADLHRMAELGVDAVISDDPGQALAALAGS